MTDTKKFKIVQIVEVSDDGKTSRIVENSIKPLGGIDSLFNLACDLIEDRLGVIRITKDQYTGFKRSVLERKFALVVIPSDNENWLTLALDADLVKVAKDTELEATKNQDASVLRFLGNEPDELFPHALSVKILENEKRFLLCVLKLVELAWESYEDAEDKNNNKTTMNMLHNSFVGFDKLKSI